MEGEGQPAPSSTQSKFSSLRAGPRGGGRLSTPGATAHTPQRPHSTGPPNGSPHTPDKQLPLVTARGQLRRRGGPPCRQGGHGRALRHRQQRLLQRPLACARRPGEDVATGRGGQATRAREMHCKCNAVAGPQTRRLSAVHGAKILLPLSQCKVEKKYG